MGYFLSIIFLFIVCILLRIAMGHDNFILISQICQLLTLPLVVYTYILKR